MKKTMTRLLALLLLLGCLLALVACGEDEKKDNDDDDEESVVDESVEGESVADDESAVSGEESLPSAAYTPAEGYTLYEKGGISFAYPSDWTLIDGETPVMSVAGGNNINMVLEAATKESTEMYKTLTEANFMERIGDALEMAGISVSNVSVERKTNDGGVEIICCSYDGSYAGAQMSFYQYMILGDDTNYVITATEFVSMADVVEELYKSIRIE